MMLNNLFKSYFNMFESKIKTSKRRRDNKIRYSSNKLFVSRAELKHSNSKIIIVLSTYNKQKSNLLKFIKKSFYFSENGVNILTTMLGLDINLIKK